MATAISGTKSPTPTPPTTNKSGALTQSAGSLGKDQFLKLLVAQLKNQDPENPMDSSQMAAQLAQFSSVEQLTQINETLTSQQTGQSSLAQLMAENGAIASVGKNITANASAVNLTGTAPEAILADIPSTARSAVLHVFDTNGKEVASQELGSVSTGRQTFRLNGSTSKISSGTYSYVVETKDSAGASSQSPTYLSGRVTGVKYTTQGPVVTVGGAGVPYMSVTEMTA